jgi:predicted transcriptional regulator
MTTNKKATPVQALLRALTLSLGEVAGHIAVSRSSAETWSAGHYQPNPEARERLVGFVEEHAKHLRTLAKAVKVEGRKRDKQREDLARERFTDWGPDTVEILKAPKTRRGRSVRALRRTYKREG